jgi:KDO2-lipid IV(A) lauroyltransferase
MDRISYFVFRASIALVSFIPFRILYFLSDVSFLFFYHVIGYRKKVVYQNLKNSFPEKSQEEIIKIAGKFYHHLSDILFESLRAFTMTELSVVKRFHIKPSKFLEHVYKEGRSVIVVAGHYNNWEWPGIAAGLQLIHKPVGFYKPLTNPYVDAYVKKTRVQGRSALVSITDTAAVFKTDWGEPAAFYMIADQSPANVRFAYWVQFLNQDTATLHGPEKYARIYNMPVVYFDVQKIKRGNYEVEFILLCENPAETNTGEITAKFMNMLEEKIRQKPEFYLWSHRRWKLKRNS